MIGRRWSRRAVAALLAVPIFLAGAAALAGERRLEAAEIEAMLAGRTAVSVGGGTAYRQYFSASGSTTYLPEDGRPSPGRWRADAARNQYCSHWEMSGWSCYDVYSEGPDGIVWVAPDSGARYPARLLDGNRL